MGADPVRMGTGTDDMKVGVNMPRKKGTGTGADEQGTGTGTGRGRPRKKPGSPKSPYTTSEKTLAQRRKNSGVSVYMNPEEQAYNAKIIQHAVAVQQIALTADIKDIASLQNAFTQYITLCAENGCKVSNMGACAALGIAYHTLDDWLHNDRRPDYQKLAQTIKQFCALTREELISDGKINPVIGIFWQRNFDGLRNDTEQIQSIKDDNAFEKKTREEMINRYIDQLDE